MQNSIAAMKFIELQLLDCLWLRLTLMMLLYTCMYIHTYVHMYAANDVVSVALICTNVVALIFIPMYILYLYVYVSIYAC